MSDNRYDKLKKKYDTLLEENEYLREKIRKSEFQHNPATSLRLSPIQNTQQKQKDRGICN